MKEFRMVDNSSGKYIDFDADKEFVSYYNSGNCENLDCMNCPLFLSKRGKGCFIGNNSNGNTSFEGFELRQLGQGGYRRYVNHEEELKQCKRYFEGTKTESVKELSVTGKYNKQTKVFLTDQRHLLKDIPANADATLIIEVPEKTITLTETEVDEILKIVRVTGGPHATSQLAEKLIKGLK